ncbi:MAG: integration host factor subunit beta [Candidatus Shikimatogenerans bostrichidophilus]|nr:MAG: integration host factor subunit beta [Candidatus Shikimatogenerans bostrichidophilus]
MTKNDIIDDISSKTEMSKKNIKKVIECLSETVKNYLLSGKNIYWRKFCTFYIKKRAKKVARNISKGVSINVPAHNIPALKFSKYFVNKIKEKLPV